MMKYAVLIPFFVISSLCFGQTEREVSGKVAREFEKQYNLDNYQQVFDLFSKEMKRALPIDKTMAFLKGLKSQAGKIENRQFLNYEKTYASYKAQFERAVFIVNISVDSSSKINGLFVKPFREEALPGSERNQTALILPFKGEWTVLWGGDSEQQNYHVTHKAQKNAFDLLITENGKSYKREGKANEDYYAFGKELIAPCDAEVVQVIDGIKDNQPGEMNPLYVTGNTVILKTANQEYLCFAHFKKNSIVVDEGQKVKRGELLGFCGNSGNSSEPHLHFHIQNAEDMNKASGVKSYFEHIDVNGQLRNNYSPVKGDRVRNH